MNNIDDTAILNWLETKSVNVRDPLMYGSREMFWATPQNDDPSDPPGPSDLRAKVRAAIAATPSSV